MKSLPLYAAFVLSVLTALGLWLTGRVPGPLGWGQLVMLYPAVVVLGIAAYRGEARAGVYALLLSGVGAVLAAVQLTSGAEVPGFLGLGFPQIALVGFVLMALVLLATLEGEKPARERNLPLVFATVVAIVATGGSLYFSEVQRFLPCTLCWYQRVAMYPLALLLTLAVLRGDRWIAAYALPLSLGGGLIALYHVLEEHGVVQTLGVCSEGVSCTIRWINWLGFITIPTLALTAFVLISVALALALPRAAGRKAARAR